MKFGQLIEYNMRNIFIEKSYTKCGGETVVIKFHSLVAFNPGQGYDVINFVINLIFLIKPFLLHAQKLKTKI